MQGLEIGIIAVGSHQKIIDHDRKFDPGPIRKSRFFCLVFLASQPCPFHQFFDSLFKSIFLSQTIIDFDDGDLRFLSVRANALGQLRGSSVFFVFFQTANENIIITRTVGRHSTFAPFARPSRRHAIWEPIRRRSPAPFGLGERDGPQHVHVFDGLFPLLGCQWQGGLRAPLFQPLGHARLATSATGSSGFANIHFAECATSVTLFGSMVRPTVSSTVNQINFSSSLFGNLDGPVRIGVPAVSERKCLKKATNNRSFSPQLGFRPPKIPPTQLGQSNHGSPRRNGTWAILTQVCETCLKQGGNLLNHVSSKQEAKIFCPTRSSKMLGLLCGRVVKRVVHQHGNPSENTVSPPISPLRDEPANWTHNL